MRLAGRDIHPRTVIDTSPRVAGCAGSLTPRPLVAGTDLPAIQPGEVFGLLATTVVDDETPGGLDGFAVATVGSRPWATSPVAWLNSSRPVSMRVTRQGLMGCSRRGVLGPPMRRKN